MRRSSGVRRRCVMKAARAPRIYTHQQSAASLLMKVVNSCGPVMRGCVLVRCFVAFGAVVYAGREASLNPQSKRVQAPFSAALAPIATAFVHPATDNHVQSHHTTPAQRHNVKKSSSQAVETTESTLLWPNQKRSRRARQVLARRRPQKRRRTRPSPNPRPRARRARRHQARRARRARRRRARRSRAARPRRKSPTRRGPRPRRPRPSRPSRASRRSTACPRRRSASPSSILWYERSSRRTRPRPAFVIQLVAPRRDRRRGT